MSTKLLTVLRLCIVFAHKCKRGLVLPAADDTLISATDFICRLANATVHCSTDYVKGFQPDEADVLYRDFTEPSITEQKQHSVLFRLYRYHCTFH